MAALGLSQLPDVLGLEGTIYYLWFYVKASGNTYHHTYDR